MLSLGLSQSRKHEKISRQKHHADQRASLQAAFPGLRVLLGGVAIT
jgi:hypothetical protein